MRGEKNEFETVRNFIDAIFDGDASHENLKCWDDVKIGTSFCVCKLMFKRGCFMAREGTFRAAAVFHNHEMRDRRKAGERDKMPWISQRSLANILGKQTKGMQ
jgi:hypothetical protein